MKWFKKHEMNISTGMFVQGNSEEASTNQVVFCAIHVTTLKSREHMRGLAGNYLNGLIKRTVSASQGQDEDSKSDQLPEASLGALSVVKGNDLRTASWTPVVEKTTQLKTEHFYTWLAICSPKEWEFRRHESKILEMERRLMFCLFKECFGTVLDDSDRHGLVQCFF